MSSQGLLNSPPADHPAQPRSRRGARRRDCLVQAARRLFTRQGYEATSLQQIVGAAGGSLSTAYQLFGNKAGIFRAVVMDLATHLREQTLSDALLAQPPAVALPQIAEQLLAISVDAEVLALRRQLIAESHAMPELAVELHAWCEQALRQPLQTYFRHWIEQGEFVAADPDRLSLLFLQMCSCWHMHHLLLGVGAPPAAEDIRALARTGVALFCASPSPAAAQGASCTA